MAPDDITAIVTTLGDLARVVHDVGPAGRAEIYAQLGLTLTHHSERHPGETRSSRTL
jgi:hypothetical protein